MYRYRNRNRKSRTTIHTQTRPMTSKHVTLLLPLHRRPSSFHWSERLQCRAHGPYCLFNKRSQACTNTRFFCPARYCKAIPYSRRSATPARCETTTPRGSASSSRSTSTRTASSSGRALGQNAGWRGGGGGAAAEHGGVGGVQQEKEGEGGGVSLRSLGPINSGTHPIWHGEHQQAG